LSHQNEDMSTVIDKSAYNKECRVSEAHEYAKQMTDAENHYEQFDGKDLISASN